MSKRLLTDDDNWWSGMCVRFEDSLLLCSTETAGKLKDALRSKGCAVLQASLSSQSAANASETLPDLIVQDILPDDLEGAYDNDVSDFVTTWRLAASLVSSSQHLKSLTNEPLFRPVEEHRLANVEKLPLSGKVIACTGIKIGQGRRQRLEDTVLLLGGSWSTSLHNAVDVLIVASLKSCLREPTRKFTLAQHIGVAIAPISWLAKCWKSWTFIPPREEAAKSMPIVILTALTQREEEDCQRYLDSLCNVMITNSMLQFEGKKTKPRVIVSGKLERSEVQLAACAAGIPIVSPRWAKECGTKRELMPTSKFELFRRASADSRISKYAIIKFRRMHEENRSGPFHGMRFIFHTSVSPTLGTVCKFGSAKVDSASTRPLDSMRSRASASSVSVIAIAEELEDAFVNMASQKAVPIVSPRFIIDWISSGKQPLDMHAYSMGTSMPASDEVMEQKAALERFQSNHSSELIKCQLCAQPVHSPEEASAKMHSRCARFFSRQNAALVSIDPKVHTANVTPEISGVSSSGTSEKQIGNHSEEPEGDEGRLSKVSLVGMEDGSPVIQNAQAIEQNDDGLEQSLHNAENSICAACGQSDFVFVPCAMTGCSAQMHVTCVMNSHSGCAADDEEGMSLCPMHSKVILALHSEQVQQRKQQLELRLNAISEQRTGKTKVQRVGKPTPGLLEKLRNGSLANLKVDELTSRNMNDFLDALEQSWLERLDLEGVPLGMLGAMQRFFDAISNVVTIHTLDLQMTGLRNEHLESLSKTILACPRLSQVYIQKNHLNEIATRAFLLQTLGQAEREITIHIEEQCELLTVYPSRPAITELLKQFGENALKKEFTAAEIPPELEPMQIEGHVFPDVLTSQSGEKEHVDPMVQAEETQNTSQKTPNLSPSENMPSFNHSEENSRAGANLGVLNVSNDENSREESNPALHQEEQDSLLQKEGDQADAPENSNSRIRNESRERKSEESELDSEEEDQCPVAIKHARVSQLTEGVYKRFTNSKATHVKVELQACRPTRFALFCEALGTCQFVMRIDLESCGIGNEGVRLLCSKALPHFKWLSELDLQMNSLTDAVLPLLADTLRSHCRRLEKLHIDENHFSTAAIRQFQSQFPSSVAIPMRSKG